MGNIKRKTIKRNTIKKGGDTKRPDNTRKNEIFQTQMNKYFKKNGNIKKRHKNGLINLTNGNKYTKPTSRSVMRDLPKYMPELWNDYPILGKRNAGKRTQRSHNCFTYALNLQDPKTKNVCRRRLDDPKNKHGSCGKPQPGNSVGLPRVEGYEGYNCPNLHFRQSLENPNIFPVTENEKCPKGYYKMALVVTDKPGDNGTYHYYRQGLHRDKDGNKLVRWDHKDGGRPATNKDASGKPIHTLSKADRNYTNEGGVDYNRICNFYCVPSSDVDKTMSINIKGTNRQGGKKNKKRTRKNRTRKQRPPKQRTRKQRTRK